MDERPSVPDDPDLTPDDTPLAPDNDRLLRVAGLVGAVVALAALWAATGVLDSVAFPPTAMAERLIRATPGDLATFFIERFGHWAMRSLSIGSAVAAVILGAEALKLTASWGNPRPWRAGGILVIGAAVAIALAPAADFSPLPTVLVLGFSWASYAFASKAAFGRLEAGSELDTGRREVLMAGFGGLAGLALAGGVVGFLARKVAGPNTEVAIGVPVDPATIPDRPDWPTIDGVVPEITSPRDHYVVDIDIFDPSVEAEGWKLEVTGEVSTPLSLSFTDLQRRFELVEEYSVLTCISNEVGGPLIGNSAWRGVRLMDVLEEAGADPNAVDVVFRAADGYSDSVTADIARNPAVILAIAQNGKPLTQGHGFPCRVRVPPIYGMKNVKWLESIEVVGVDYRGYWMKRGWSDTAVVRTQSRIDVAGEDTSARKGEATWIAGVAWAGERGISKVEVSLDGGESWEEAMVRDPVAENSWRQWAYRWTPDTTGTITIACRATDGNGDTQTDRRDPPHPAGATGYHFVDVEVG